MANHLLLKDNTYQAVLDVPKDVRGKIGRTKFKQSLKTGNRREALTMVGPIVAVWKSQIEVARGNSSISQEAAVWADMRKKAKDIDERNLIDSIIVDLAYDIEAGGRSIGSGNDPETTETENAKLFVRLARNELTPLLSYVDRWLSDQALKPFTEYEYRRELERLEKRFKYIEDVNRRIASDYIAEVKAEGKKRDTIGKRLSAYKGYWDWLARHDYVDSEIKNPWQGLLPKKRQVSNSQTRRGFTDQEGAELLKRILATEIRQPDDYTVSLVLAATGMRLGEVVSLKKEDIREKDEATWVYVTDSKTVAGVRKVPIVDDRVREALRTKASAVQASEYIFKRLKADKRGKRTHQISRRLSEVLREFTDDVTLVAGHSWRHRVRTLLERGGVPIATADWLMGHKRPGEGLGRYAEGPSDEQLLEAVKCIVTPEHTHIRGL